MMERSIVVRLLALYVPATLVVLGWALHPPRKRAATAALLACGWSVTSLLFVNVVAIRAGWWNFGFTTGTLAGVPADLLLGWILLWGAAPVLLPRRLPIALVVAFLAMLDIIVMPLGEPLVHLGPRWLIGEAMAVCLSLIPAQLLARWTISRKHLAWRAAMQAATFTVLVLWVIPEVILQQTGNGWLHFLSTWNTFGGLPIQLVLLPAVMGMSAVHEFATRGGGTPIPFDPPERLVTTGPYAYVANPMQLSMALVLTLWGVVVGSWWVMLMGPMSVVYGCGLAAADEGATLGGRFAVPWRAYRQHVRAWIPRMRPYHASVDGEEGNAAPVRPARLYVAATCGVCSEVAAWFNARRPRGLVIVPAELHPMRDLRRITYDPGDGASDEEGVAAIARALEHVHVGWAFIGWTMRLPLLRTVLQLVVDASGGEPKLIARANASSGSPTQLEAPSCPR